MIAKYKTQELSTRVAKRLFTQDFITVEQLNHLLATDKRLLKTSQATKEVTEATIQAMCEGENPFAMRLGDTHLIRCGNNDKRRTIRNAIQTGKAKISMFLVTPRELEIHLISLTKPSGDEKKPVPPKILLSQEEMQAIAVHLFTGPDKFATLNEQGYLIPIKTFTPGQGFPATKAIRRRLACCVW